MYFQNSNTTILWTIFWFETSEKQFLFEKL